MTRIRATCPDCGEVDLAANDVVLRVEADVGDTATSYRFDCPDCDVTVVKPADHRVSRLLAAGGVSVEHVGMATLELALARLVREARPVPAPFAPDDLLDFHELLASHDCLTQLLGTA